MSAEVFETFDRHALAALQARDVPRVRAADYFSKTEESDATADEELARWDEYFAHFAKLTDAKCLCCGTSLRCTLGLGIFGGFEWGLAHGEGHCSCCRYPMRGHHVVEGLGKIHNLFLAYHPSALSFPSALSSQAAARGRSLGVQVPMARRPRHRDGEPLMTAPASGGRKGYLRVSWDIASHGQGHGEWQPPKTRSMLMSHVYAMNKKYGAGTHWLEEHE